MCLVGMLGINLVNWLTGYLEEEKMGRRHVCRLQTETVPWKARSWGAESTCFTEVPFLWQRLGTLPTVLSLRCPFPLTPGVQPSDLNLSPNCASGESPVFCFFPANFPIVVLSPFKTPPAETVGLVNTFNTAEVLIKESGWT